MPSPRADADGGSVSDILLSVVIVNWNGKGFLDKCLDSIYGQGVKGLEVILVDNGSNDGSVEFVRERFPQTIIIENSANLGFARANNQGIESARGKYILTLNNDTELDDNFFRELIGVAEGSPARVGMWAAKILSMADNREIDSVGGLLLYPDGLAKGRGRLDHDHGQYDGWTEALMPSACAGLYRKKMLDEIGGFDEDFFAYCEDTDLGLRARLAGWSARSVPTARVYHYYSGTGGRYTPFKAFLVERNHLWVAMKNLPVRYLLLLPFYTFWRYAVQVYGVFTGKGAGGRFVEDFSKLGLFKVLVRAYISALRGMPAMLGKRRNVQKKRAVSSREINDLFKEHRLSTAELVLKD